ncbi:MAG: Lrp/AsnC family transcriptional regulator [Candidatus Bathyarchaeota archaeon]|nr:MAG: Lrp/AsnC family transcriptional regulator [Candidatus Bathyarchaeota archaeon]
MKTKNQLNSLDDLDWAILKTLQENARLTYTEIGRRLNLAHSTIYDRVKKMEKQKIIKKYAALIDLKKARLKLITAILTIFTDPKESEKVAKELANHDQVLEVFSSLSEEFVIIVKTVAEDQEKLHDFIAKFVAPLPGVLRIRTSIITRKYKEENFSF